MKILFITLQSLKSQLGGPKVIIETSQALSNAGAFVQCIHLIEDDERADHAVIKKRLSQAIMSRQKEQWDVIDFECGLSEYFNVYVDNFPTILFVVRSVLLPLHFDFIRIPHRSFSILGGIKHSLMGVICRSRSQKRVQDSILKYMSADCINVCGTRDVSLLEKCGYPKDRIVLQHYGISHEREKSLKVKQCSLPYPVIGMLGTFDFRKGCLDVSKVFGKLSERFPNLRLRLIGAKGLFQTERQILSQFSEPLRNRIEVIMTFEPEELSIHLEGIGVLIFPSYVEGYPFGVMESLVAGLPVVAYDSPGPCDQLPKELLVEVGNWSGVATTVAGILRCPEEIPSANLTERIAYWNEIAPKLLNDYRQKLSDKRQRLIECSSIS